MPLAPRLSRPVIITSLAVAGAAWVALVPAMYFRVHETAAIIAVAIAWPIVYAACIGMCWFMVKMIGSADQSVVYGPRNDLQLKLMRGPGVWWINAVSILFPLAVLLISLLVLCGLISDTSSAST